MYTSVFESSHTCNDVGVYNMRGLEDYLFAVLDENENLPCTLADGIFVQSDVMMTTKFYDRATDDNNVSTNVLLLLGNQWN